MSAFSPGATLTFSATDSSIAQAFAGTGSQVVIANAGPNTAFVKFGGSTITSTTAAFPVLSGQALQLSRSPDTHTHVAAICATGETATVYVTPGDGD